MKKLPLALLLFALSAFLLHALVAPQRVFQSERPCAQFGNSPQWGFFGHKRINRLAVLTLPPEMMVFFKPNIDWISDHAPDPDMRRYATSWEAPRHYIDLDNYGTAPFADLPRRFDDAMIRYCEIWGVNDSGDSVLVAGPAKPHTDEKTYRRYFIRQVLPQFYADKEQLDPDSLQAYLGGPRYTAAFFKDMLSPHGILPWNLSRMQRELTAAFRRRDSRRILRLCADIGHYVADGHVPLHTSSNYNGQKTGQDGIHGFWESRIPELFADDQYDYFVGKPEYINNPDAYFWQFVLESNSMVDSVLLLERNLRLTFPPDRQMCPDMRNGRVVVAPCREFAASYQESMQGMVERRMRAAIRAVASIWYTAWMDAGQPNLSNMDAPVASAQEEEEEGKIQRLFESGRILGRPEDH